MTEYIFIVIGFINLSIGACLWMKNHERVKTEGYETKITYIRNYDGTILDSSTFIRDLGVKYEIKAIEKKDNNENKP